MALFGLEKVPDRGARAALACAFSMFEAVDGLNHSLADELESPIVVGVGIHTGEAIAGKMGFRRRRPFLQSATRLIRLLALKMRQRN